MIGPSGREARLQARLAKYENEEARASPSDTLNAAGFERNLGRRIWPLPLHDFVSPPGPRASICPCPRVRKCK